MILFNFSVIAKPGQHLGERQPDSHGMSIWRMFHESTIGRICLIINEEYQKPVLEDWLKVERIKPAFYEMFEEPSANLKAERIHRIGAVFGKPEWYIDNDPMTCSETLKLGIPTILVASPYIVRPEWSSERVIKSWDTLVQEMDEQALKAANKTWRE